MARLNEPPIAPTPNPLLAATAGSESIDALKRRFTRQNRELAKVNSSQALQIQGLKSEVERVTGQNQDLKELVLRLQGELHSANTHAALVQAKIAELSGLLGHAGPRSQDNAILSRNAVKSPTPRQYRERQPLGELMRDSQMPTIIEHKSYPRRTLDTNDIWNLRLSDHSSNGSPDIGPPPVAHFDCNGSKASGPTHESSPSLDRNDSHDGSVEHDLLASSVETRRKRKDGLSKPGSRRSSILALSPVKDDLQGATNTILRTGAKRKFADRENDKSMKTLPQCDLSADLQIENEVAQQEFEEFNSGNLQAASKQPRSPFKPVRRVLGEKSGNLSPRKPQSRSERTVKDDADSVKPVPSVGATKTEKATSRSRRLSALPIPSPPRERIDRFNIAPTELLYDEHEPNTPADIDIFSPTLSHEKAAESTGSRDTPPPCDLSSISNTTDGGQRPSRRARSTVNYAEPSLNAKMRRPGKQMVDAISGLRDPRLVMSTATDKKFVPTSRTVFIKKESIDDEETCLSRSSAEPNSDHLPSRQSLMEAESGSPLVEKGVMPCASETLPSLTSAPHKYLSSIVADETGPIAKPTRTTPGMQTNSASIASTSAAIGSTKLTTANTVNKECTRRLRDVNDPLHARAPVDDEVVDNAARKREELDLYDFKDSSSSPPPPSRAVEAGALRSHRRHSSVPKNGGSGSLLQAARADRVAARRRSMML